MALSYEEALATLQSMFSDQGYSAQQLDAVLRHHGGHMEHTVETLLTHGEGTPDELIKKLPSLPAGGSAANNAGGGGSGSAAHNIDADEELARQLAAEDQRQQQRGANRSTTQSSGRGMLGLASAQGGGNRAPPPGQQRRPMASTVTAPSRPKPAAAAAPKPPAGTKGRGTPTVLPVDFLRIPGRKYPAGAGSSAAASNAAVAGQPMSDEQLARMLQDELFQEELRNNPEFSHLAGRRNPSVRAGAGQTAGRGGAGGGGVGWGERTDFFDRLSELGDNAKRRFQELAAGWNDPNKQGGNRRLFGGASQSLNAANQGNERRGLLANDLNMDEEEEEMNFIGGGRSSGNDFEMNDVGSSGRVDWSGDKKKD
eukprot:CAMPEP_0183702876 /NCGR_PEP_ID=MMETSP0737-20130205/830_1 /TAXON_ID=385413 /ORGANISM="Thalassiosira miniscula, Strain CCMP1093" /LENGTH=368 /DNA_ID=CAMNT_0025929559 /DNA_START=70 /DNA_END=1176 /DNA_ORIENTATION=+